VIVFDSEDAANAATEQLRSGMPDVAMEQLRSGMPDMATVDEIDVREVVAHA
jgi:hypothetical protein